MPNQDDRADQAAGISGRAEEIERGHLDATRTFLLHCGYPGSGEDFFESLARHLAQSLGMDYVCIDRLEGDGLHARTVAVFNDGAFETNVTYALKDTPCGDVVGKTICCFPRDVCALFPNDAALQDLKAESYIGTTLWSYDGKPIGLIALIGRTPLANRGLADATLRLVAVRAAGELERRQAEEVLRESEERYHGLFRNATLGIFHSTFEGGFIDVNPALAQLLGYASPEETVRLVTNIAEQIYADPHRRDAIGAAALQAGGTVSSENQFRRRDGTTWTGMVHLRIVPDQQGRPSHYEGFIEDITERKLREAEIQSLARFPSENPNPVLRISRSGAILYANEAAGTFLREWGCSVGDTVPEFWLKAIEETVARAKDTVIEKTIGQRIFSVFVAPVIPADYVNFYASDISERVKAQEELSKARNLAALGVLAGGIAHDFNNLLQGLLGGIAMAKHLTPRTSKAYPFLDLAEKTVGDSAALADKLIAFAPGGISTRTTIQPGGLIREAVAAALSGSGIRPVFDLSDDLPAVHADVDQVRRIVENIAMNAREAMASGGELQVSATQETIGDDEVAGLAPGRYLRITIRDQGPGIAPEILPKIFDPYFSTKNRGSVKGTGLGLTISDVMVKKHHGAITVEPEPGKGAIFHIHLPAAASGEPPSFPLSKSGLRP